MSLFSSWKGRLVVVVLLLAALGICAAYWLRPVAFVVAVTRGKAVRAVPGTVEVKAEFISELKSEVAGRVSASALDVGLKVHEGDLLVQLDTGDVDLAIERIRSEILAARRRVEIGSTMRADVLNTRDTVATLERQTAAGAYPVAELEKQKRSLQQLEQRMELDEVNLKLALESLENQLRSREREKQKMTITAPSNGVVTEVLARVGDLIGGNAPIAALIATTRTVEAKLSEENFAAVKVGQKATVRFLTYGADQYNATVTKILPSADPQTQRYTVFLDVALPEGKTLVPGLTGEVQIIISERDNALIIPRRALIGEYVYAIEGNAVVRRQVQKGYASLNQVEILGGLALGDQVVAERQDSLREGDRVRVQVLEK